MTPAGHLADVAELDQRLAHALAEVAWFKRRIEVSRTPLSRALYREGLEVARERLERAEAALS